MTFAVNVLAKQITIWSVNDDRRAARLLGCLSTTVDLAHLMVIKDPLDEFHLALYCGAISLEIQNDDVDFWLCDCAGRIWNTCFPAGSVVVPYNVITGMTPCFHSFCGEPLRTDTGTEPSSSNLSSKH